MVVWQMLILVVLDPPSSAEFQSSRLTPTITTAPFPEGAELEPFLDAQPNSPFGNGTTQQFAIPQAQTGNIQTFPIFDANGNQIGTGNGAYPRAPFGTNSNPLQPGVTEISEDGTEFGLPSLFQYPKRFLASLQTQVTNGNAKILTDPTLIVQEGQEARVDLTQEVVGNIESTFADTAGGSREVRTVDKEKVGLTVGVKIERIDDNGFVSLSVAPSVKAPAGQQNTGQGFVTSNF